MFSIFTQIKVVYNISQLCEKYNGRHIFHFFLTHLCQVPSFTNLIMHVCLSVQVSNILHFAKVDTPLNVEEKKRDSSNVLNLHSM